jgi:hypothetical protein
MDTEQLLARLSPQARGELLSRLDGPVPRNTRPAARQPVRRRVVVLAGFVTLLYRHTGNAVADPARPVSHLPLLADTELAELSGWNATEPARPDFVAVPAMLSEQVVRKPDAEAVEAGTEALTYQALNDQAGHLADRLRAPGTAPGTPVGVLLDGCIGPVVALVGTLAAGVADRPTPLSANGNGGRRTVAALAPEPQAPAQRRYIAPRGATVDNPTVVGVAAHIERVSGAAG